MGMGMNGTAQDRRLPPVTPLACLLRRLPRAACRCPPAPAEKPVSMSLGPGADLMYIYIYIYIYICVPPPLHGGPPELTGGWPGHL